MTALSEDPVLWTKPDEAKRLMREKSGLEKTIGEWDSLDGELRDSCELHKMADDEGDSAMVAEISQQAVEMLRRVDALELQRMLSEEHDISNAFLEIHPGAGGTESQDWAEMLLRMYLRWCEAHGYKTEISDYQPGEEAGCKSVSVRIEGEFAYGYLKTEGGVHRLVRISPFDSAARRHTSFSSVFVYPEVDDIALTDYKVRIINAAEHTHAKVCVSIESFDKTRNALWGTVGANENIIEASWDALRDSFVYGLAHRRTDAFAEAEAEAEAGVAPSIGG